MQPLLAHQKGLTPAQKEKATELLFSADELDTQAKESTVALELLKHPLEMSIKSTIHIFSMLHVGVIIRYPGITAAVTSSQRGPMTISLSSHDGQRVIVSQNEHGGTKIRLHTVESPTH